MPKRKKSLVGWTHKYWLDWFKFIGQPQWIETPKIHRGRSKTKNWPWRKVRITIEEV